MTSQCLNNLFLLYIHIPQTDALDLVSIAREFVSVNSRRLNYILWKILGSIVCCVIILFIILLSYLLSYLFCKE